MSNELDLQPIALLSDDEYRLAIEEAFRTDNQVGLYFLDAARYPLLGRFQDTMLAQMMEHGQMLTAAIDLVNDQGKPFAFHHLQVSEYISRNPAQVFEALGEKMPVLSDADAHLQRYLEIRNGGENNTGLSVAYTDGMLDHLSIQELPVKQLNIDDFSDRPTDKVLLDYDDEQRLVTFESEQSTVLRMLAGLESSQTDSALEEAMLHQLQIAEAAREYLIKANTRMVISMAKRKLGSGMAFLDLIQEGNLGLLRGVDKFDYRMGTRLSTYVHWWIRQKIGRGSDQQADTIRRPLHAKHKVRYYLALAEKLTDPDGNKPSFEALAGESRFRHSPEQIRDLLNFYQPVSLQQPRGDRDDEEFGDSLDSGLDTENEALRRLVAKELLVYVNEIVTNLKHRQVLLLRFGLDETHPEHYGQPLTLQEVADIFSVTPERIRQIEAHTLKLLRHPKNSFRIKGLLG